MFYIVSTCHAIRANDVIYMEERNGDPSKATHTVNDADTPDYGSRSDAFLFPPALTVPSETCSPQMTDDR